MKFVMHRDRVVASRLGHAIEFKKGEPTHVPPALIREVLEAGGEPDETLQDDPRDQKPPVESTEPTDPVERAKALNAAFEKMVADNVRGSFTATGLPNLKTLSKVLGWTVEDKERDEAWAKFQQAQ